MTTPTADAVSITRDLVRCPSVTPADAGALGVLENILKAAGTTSVCPAKVMCGALSPMRA